MSDTRLERIEQKLDTLADLVLSLMDLLAEETGDEPPSKTLDGDLDGGERDQNQPL